MPPICYHLDLAKEAALRLTHPILERNRGNYLLGSTLPDVHIITQASREKTHFFDLDNPSPQSGAEALFLLHPELEEASQLNEDMSALVAGYLCHLLTDEVWIQNIYRPFFGQGALWGDEPLASIWDRALQYELDRRAHADQANMAQVRSHLASAMPQRGLRLPGRTPLKKWQHFVVAATAREPTWDGFASFAHRFLLPRAKVTPEQLDSFVTSLPQGMEPILRQVGEGRLRAFRQEAVARSMAAAREYLDAHHQG